MLAMVKTNKQTNEKPLSIAALWMFPIYLRCISFPVAFATSFISW